MSFIRRITGLDGLDLLIHIGVTVCIMAVGSGLWSGAAAETMMATVTGVSLVVLGIRRKSALGRGPTESTDEVTAGRLEELESRLGELEQVYFRMQELEERLDFAERLLAERRSEPAQLERRR